MEIKTFTENVDKNKLIEIILERSESDLISEPKMIGVLNNEPVFELVLEDWGDIDGPNRCIFCFNVFGEVMRCKDDSLYQFGYGAKTFNSFKDVAKYVSSVNQGVEIAGKSYAETLKELHKEIRREKYLSRADKAKIEYTQNINRAIRLSQEMDEIMQNI